MSQQMIEVGRDIAFSAARDVQAAIARIGRTEDVQFSPDGRHLALPGLKTNRLLILDVETELSKAQSRVALTGFLEVESTGFNAPHGIAWVDSHTLVVANREGLVSVVELPRDRTSASIEIEPVRMIGGGGTDLVKTPGSLSVRPAGMGLLELLVCNNYVDHMTRHLLDRREDYRVIASEILLGDGMAVPDGIAQSASGRWIAISNHDHQNVLLLRDDEREPQGLLSGLCYPHGLRFCADERCLLVADAGAPFVRIYRSDDGNWAGPRDPSCSIRVLGDADFRRGNHSPREGGPKGMDLSRDNRLMVTSCEARPLAFFDMRGLLHPVESSPGDIEIKGDEEHARKTLVRYLAAARNAAQQETEAIRRAGAFDREALIARQFEIRALMMSRSWRLTAPLRSFSAAVQRIRHRR
jgi:hypothetical protein